MDKQRKWQFFLILTIIALTIYNILPTLFYYSQPLKKPVDQTAAKEIALSIEERIASLEKGTLEWLHSYCDLIHVKPLSVSIDSANPQIISLKFAKSDEAHRFRLGMPRAGSLIPFPPAQLFLPLQENDTREVLVQRRLPLSLEKDFFTYAPKDDRRLLIDRVQQIAIALTGPSEFSAHLNRLQLGDSLPSTIDALAAQINGLSTVFEEGSPLAARYAAHFMQGAAGGQTALRTLIHSFDQTRDALRREKNRLKELKEQDKEETIQALERKEQNLLSAEMYLKKHLARFNSNQSPWTPSEIVQALEHSDILDISNVNPLFSTVSIDLSKDRFVLTIHPDVVHYRSSANNKALFEQLLIDEAAKIARFSNEDLIPGETEIAIPMHRLPNVSGYLVLDQKKLAQQYAKQIQASLQSQWMPRHPDLQNLSIVDYETYKTLPLEQKALCLVIASPLLSSDEGLTSFKPHALYVVAKGIDRIIKNYEAFPDSPLAQDFSSDFRKLAEILYRDGFYGAAGSSFFETFTLKEDFVFEKPNFSATLLSATREDFIVRGTQKMALIELADIEQRIVTQNKIENQIHQDLLKWKDDYRAAQVSLDKTIRFDVPKPTKSIFWNNVILSAKKIFRGDERKIIRWGLDLSGGKTVQVVLRDSNRQLVKTDADLKQGINELYNRVNKMGVSEVSIRQAGHHIVLDFPSSQAMSASELIKASTMYFHVVNEKFSSSNPALADSANRFLQEIWNEASVTGKKDAHSINAIAIKHLHSEQGALRSEAARILWENGLRLALPDDNTASNALDDSLSKIASFRGTDFTEWHGQSHPLLIVFRNWAMEGAHLENIHAGYEPGKGNFLSFDISSSYQTREGRKVQPRNDLFTWTSRYSKENVLGTSLEAYSKGRGWRMAVLLNDSVINAPTLDSPLRDSAMISGSFSQREVNRLAADLKAGSLTFTPEIVSEKNVSPELGKADRVKGIAATCAALLLIIGCMIAYYRFAGMIASIAVILNLLILWATLQNLGATLTLAGLAGVILTVAMAVDANVLVYERIKEEFAESGKIGSAIAIGYKKAYSAIVDSNITTIIAALILLNFDAGPIKSFAINLIIGIASSMITALFMTRFYFTGWAQKPKNKALKMANWICSTQFDFLKWAKKALGVAVVLIAVGSALIFVQRSSIFGMDFTGGYSLNLELKEAAEDKNYAASVEEALVAAGASTRDFQVRELTPSNHLRILFGTTLEQPGKPFYQMPIESDKPAVQYSFEKNPRIEWILNALEQGGLSPQPQTLPHLDSSWTATSGQMSDSMRNNALMGLFISFVCIFIYLSVRFEYKFAAAALICLFHDVLITLALIGLLYAFGVEIQIDLNTIAALMTIVGYSLNDTIIIFDRIREELRLTPGKNLTTVVNYALNTTLSRTTITSGTTLLVLIALVLLGGPSIFGFALVMAIGVFFGTLSSWFIAAPLMIFFHQREDAKEALA